MVNPGPTVVYVGPDELGRVDLLVCIHSLGRVMMNL